MKKDLRPVTSEEYREIVMKLYITYKEYARLIGISVSNACTKMRDRMRYIENPRPAPKGAMHIMDFCEWQGMTIAELREGAML